jgi:streptomycin 6-kinase
MANTLQDYPEKWNLSEILPLAQTKSSYIYLATHCGERVVLKILNATGQKEERYGAVTLRYFNGEDSEEPLHALAIAAIVEPHIKTRV